MTQSFDSRPIANWIAFRRAVSALVLVLVILACAWVGNAQQDGGAGPEGALSSTQQRIREQLAALNSREMANAPNRELGYRWTVLGYEYSKAGDFVNAENAYNRAVERLSLNPADTSLDAEALDQLGALYRIHGRIPESLNCRRKVLALREKIGDPAEIAQSQSHLAEVALVAKQYKEAYRGADGAYRAMAALESSKKSDLVSALVVRAYASCGLHRHSECLSDAQQVLGISRSAFPENSPEVSASLLALSYAQLRNGAASEAEDAARQGLAILKANLSPGDPRLRFALSQDRDCLQALHRKEEAREIDAQISAFDRSAQSCAFCTVSVSGLRTTDH